MSNDCSEIDLVVLMTPLLSILQSMSTLALGLILPAGGPSNPPTKWSSVSTFFLGPKRFMIDIVDYRGRSEPVELMPKANHLMVYVKINQPPQMKY